MATRPVRFEFHCEGQKLNFQHDLPASLVTASADVNKTQSDPAYMKAFVSAIEPVMNQHERACFSATSDKCEVCGDSKLKVLMTPMSWLHNVSDPFINVWVGPICGKPKCEMEERQRIQSAMSLLGEQANQELAAEGKNTGPDTKEVLACKICGKIDGAKHCANCRVVAYCGKEHQKQDWKLHKRVCGHLAQNNVNVR